MVFGKKGGHFKGNIFLGTGLAQKYSGSFPVFAERKIGPNE